MVKLRDIWMTGCEMSAPDLRAARSIDIWAKEFISAFTQYTGENRQKYSREFNNLGQGNFEVAFASRHGKLREFGFFLETQEKQASITLLNIRERGKSIGRFAVETAIKGLKNLDFNRIELTAQGMGPGFWPQLGFVIEEIDKSHMEKLRARYEARLEILAPYLSAEARHAVAEEISSFSPATPKNFLKIGFEREVAALVANSSLLQQIGISPPLDPEYSLKLGTLMNIGMSMPMVLAQPAGPAPSITFV